MLIAYSRCVLRPRRAGKVGEGKGGGRYCAYGAVLTS
jgi:hypothetical protein